MKLKKTKIKKETRGRKKIYWARHLKLLHCLECGRRDRKHHSFGLCENCYCKSRYLNSPEEREKRKARTYAWMRKNKDQWRAIARRAIKNYRERHRVIPRTQYEEKSERIRQIMGQNSKGESE